MNKRKLNILLLPKKIFAIIILSICCITAVFGQKQRFAQFDGTHEAKSSWGYSNSSSYSKVSVVTGSCKFLTYSCWDSWVTSGNVFPYLVYRAKGNEPMSLFSSVDGNMLLFADTRLQLNTRYQYSIKVVYTDGNQSGFSKPTIINF